MKRLRCLKVIIEIANKSYLMSLSLSLALCNDIIMQICKKKIALVNKNISLITYYYITQLSLINMQRLCKVI